MADGKEHGLRRVRMAGGGEHGLQLLAAAHGRDRAVRWDGAGSSGRGPWGAEGNICWLVKNESLILLGGGAAVNSTKT